MHLNYANFTQGGSTNKKILELPIPPHPHRSKNINSEINITFPPLRENLKLLQCFILSLSVAILYDYVVTLIQSLKNVYY